MGTRNEEVLLRVGMDHSGVSKGLMQVTHNIKDGFEDLGKDILAGFTFGALVSKLEGVFEQVERMNAAASKTGIDAESFQKLSTVAKQDLPQGAEKFEAAMTKLNVKLGEGAAELEKWGIHSTTAKEAMYEIADKMAETEDPAKRAAMAVDLMGKSGADMVPLLERGAKALEGFVHPLARARLPVHPDPALTDREGPTARPGEGEAGHHQVRAPHRRVDALSQSRPDAVEHFPCGGGARKAVLARLELRSRPHGANQFELPGEAHDARFFERGCDASRTRASGNIDK